MQNCLEDNQQKRNEDMASQDESLITC